MVRARNFYVEPGYETWILQRASELLADLACGRGERMLVR